MTTLLQHHLIGVSVGAYVVGTTAGTGDNPMTSITGSAAQNTVVADAPADTGLDRAIEMAQVSGQANSLIKTFASSGAVYMRDYIKSISPFTATSHVMLRAGLGSGVRGFDLQYNSLLKYRAFNAANAQVDETVNGTFVLDRWLRREVYVDPTNFWMNLYEVGSSAPLFLHGANTHTVEKLAQPANTFGTAFDRYTWGIQQTTPLVEVQRYAGITISDSAMPAPLEPLDVGDWQIGSIAM